MRASMQASTATCLAGGSGSGPVKRAAYSALLASSSSVTDMSDPFFGGMVRAESIAACRYAQFCP